MGELEIYIYYNIILYIILEDDQRVNIQQYIRYYLLKVIRWDGEIRSLFKYSNN